MAADDMHANLSRLRNYIHQGKIEKIKHLFIDQSEQLHYLFEQKFDACACATKFQQEQILRLLHDYGKFIIISDFLIFVLISRISNRWLSTDTFNHRINHRYSWQ